ncbi:MAG: PKD domain-containing protein [Kiritimatiellia bacterium]
MRLACQSLKWIHCLWMLLILLLSPSLRADAPPSWAIPSSRLRLRLCRTSDSAWPANAGVATLAAGALDPEKTGFTVTTPQGQPVPSSLLWARKGQPLLLTFDTSSGATSYYAYAIENTTPPDANAWRPKAGVLLETRTLNQPAFDSRAQFESAWNATTGTFGRSFRADIFDGTHPHGPPEQLLARYEAWFQADQAGDYGFATLSDDASFVAVDGKPVTEWPGIHRADAGRNGEKNGTLRLEPGLHHLRYDLAQGDGLLAAVASWRPPGAKYYRVMQPSNFTALARFSSCAAEAPPAAPTAHFEWRVDRSARLGPVSLIGVSFRAMPLAGASYSWTFGDGTRGEGESLEHVFIQPGTRPVRLEVRSPGTPPITLEQPVEVHPLWRQIEECPDSALFPLKAAVQARAMPSLTPAELEAVARFADLLGDRVWLEQTGRECLRRQASFAPDFAPVIFAMAATFRHALFRNYTDAETMFELARKTAAGPESGALNARIALARAENCLNGRQDASAAKTLLEALREEGLGDSQKRRRNLLLADAHLALGSPDKARAIVRALKPMETGPLAGVRLQARLITAADLVRRNEWNDAADRLESILNDFPEERFKTETGLLLMDAYSGRGEHLPSLALGDRLLQVESLDDARARLLLRLANLRRDMGDPVASARYRERLKAEFPYSEAAALSGNP